MDELLQRELHADPINTIKLLKCLKNRFAISHLNLGTHSLQLAFISSVLLGRPYILAHGFVIGRLSVNDWHAVPLEILCLIFRIAPSTTQWARCRFDVCTILGVKCLKYFGCVGPNDLSEVIK